MRIFKKYKEEGISKLIGGGSRSRFKKAGFTLIELLVVISIIALLSSVVLASVNTARQKAQISKVRSDMEEFAKALELYRTSFGSYPKFPLGSWLQDQYQLGVPASTLTEVTDNVSALLKTKKLYMGDLTKSLISLPKLGYMYISYVTDPVELSEYFSRYYSCGGIKTFNNYYIQIYLQDIDSQLYGQPSFPFTSSYWNKEIIDWGEGPSELGDYCMGN